MTDTITAEAHQAAESGENGKKSGVFGCLAGRPGERCTVTFASDPPALRVIYDGILGCSIVWGTDMGDLRASLVIFGDFARNMNWLRKYLRFHLYAITAHPRIARFEGQISSA